MRTYLLLITILLISIVAIAQVKKPSTKTTAPTKTVVNTKKIKKTSNHGTFTDKRDGNQYKWVRIGKQVWMAENLCYIDQYLLGGTLDKGSDIGSDYEPYSYIYNYDDIDDTEANKTIQKYGVLYNWPAAKLACPKGWHLPTDAEWDILINYLGGKEIAGGKMQMTGTTFWKSPNKLATNSSGFSALPGGTRTSYDGTFKNLGTKGEWWSATEAEYSTHSAWDRGLDYSGCSGLVTSSQMVSLCAVSRINLFDSLYLIKGFIDKGIVSRRFINE